MFLLREVGQRDKNEGVAAAAGGAGHAVGRTSVPVQYSPLIRFCG